MIERIHCIFHEEKTPSMVVYHDHAFCYGCNKRASLDQVGIDSKRMVRRTSLPKENLYDSMQKIRKMPIKTIRGFPFHYDRMGFYIVYPNSKYYVYRKFESSLNKYRSPIGHQKPLWDVNRYNTDLTLLFVVEGQLNAMSLAVVTNYAVCSPGSAGDLNRPKFIEYYLQYERICIIVDKDAAGVSAAISLKNKLLAKGKKVAISAVTTDFNELYVKEGQQSIKEQEKHALSLFGLPQLQWSPSVSRA